jgi:DNA-binding Lrp family transcriptional regulator
MLHCDAMLLVRAVDVAEVHYFVTEVLSLLPEIRAVESVLVMDEVIRRPYSCRATSHRSLLPCSSRWA